MLLAKFNLEENNTKNKYIDELKILHSPWFKQFICIDNFVGHFVNGRCGGPLPKQTYAFQNLIGKNFYGFSKHFERKNNLLFCFCFSACQLRRFLLYFCFSFFFVLVFFRYFSVDYTIYVIVQRSSISITFYKLMKWIKAKLLSVFISRNELILKLLWVNIQAPTY